MIVQLLRNKEVLQDTSLLSNRYDNKSTDIKINLVDEFVNESYFYYLICKSPDKNVTQFAVPLVLDLETKSLTYLVRSTITNTIGNWDFCLLIKELAIVGGVINDDGLIAISEHFIGKIKSGIINEESLGEQPLEEPLQLIYDILLATEANISANEEARKVFETFNISKSYKVENKVSYLGSSYYCISDCIGVLPTDVTKWLLIAKKGDKGDTGDTGDKGDTGDTGNTGKGLEFSWNGTQLGVRVEGEALYQYIDLKGDKGNVGDTGNGISSIIRTDGNGAAGTTDTFTITFTNGTTTTFQVYNGADGLGTGDMLKSVYDINNSGQVDKADDTDKFGGQSPSYYAKATDIPDISGKLDSTHNTDETAHSDIRTSINDLVAEKAGTQISFLGTGKNENSGTTGDATIIKFSNGQIMAIDFHNVANLVKIKSAYAEREITKLDYIIISHFHDDHVGCLQQMVIDGAIDITGATVFLPQPLNLESSLISPTTAQYYNDLMTLFATHNCTLVYPTEEQIYSISGCDVVFFNTEHTQYYSTTTDYNNLCMCNYIFCGNTSVFFASDLGVYAMGLLEGNLYKANILKAQHHGWDNTDYSNIVSYMNSINPDVVITEDGIEHIELIETASAPLQTWCERYNVSNYRTVINDTIDVNVNDGGYRILTKASRFLRAVPIDVPGGIVTPDSLTYLYKLGYEYIPLTGGWEAIKYSTSPYVTEGVTLTKNTDNLNITTVTGYGSKSAWFNTINMVDFTNFTKLKIKYSLSGTFQICRMAIKSTKPSSSDWATTIGHGQVDLQVGAILDAEIDISEISSGYPMLYLDGTSLQAGSLTIHYVGLE